MPLEARYILFTLDEVEALVRRFAYARKLALPEGRLRRIETVAEGLRFAFESNFSRKQAITLDPSVVMAAVLLDCRHQHVPIARAFHKRLEAQGDGMALVATLDCIAVPAADAVQRRVALAEAG